MFRRPVGCCLFLDDELWPEDRLSELMSTCQSLPITDKIQRCVTCKAKKYPLKCTCKGCLVKETDRTENRFSRFSLFFYPSLTAQTQTQWEYGLWLINWQLLTYSQSRIIDKFPPSVVTNNLLIPVETVWTIANHRAWHLIVIMFRCNRFSSQEPK